MVRVINLSQILVNCRTLMSIRTASRPALNLKADTFTASILRTHSQCQTRSWNSFLNPAKAGISCLHLSGTKEWWSLSGSNRRPDACKATALPAELKPLTHSAHPSVAAKLRLMGALCCAGRAEGCALQLSLLRLIPCAMVGRVGVEPTTSRLSGVRSNHLSYRPPSLAGHKAARR